MNLTLRKGEAFPSLLSDFFGTFGRDFSELAPEFFPSRLGVSVPRANIMQTPTEYKLELAAPGLERKDFNVEVKNHTLIISAEKEEREIEEDEDFSRREYSFNSFSRSFALPENIKEGEIDAKYENGLLIVSIPKLKETPVKSAHKIEVW